jgi:L-lactate dehydrogenase complex protein LldF
MSSYFKRQVDKAFDDPHLRTTLTLATNHLKRLRTDALADNGHFATLQAAARAVRWRTLLRLPELLEQLEDEVTKQGGHVIWAEDAQAANRIIVELAERHGATRIVKARSNTSEEIGLSDALLAAGLEVVETQLGDYILQLGDGSPSHPVFSALHRRREDVAALFEDKLDMPQTLNVQGMAGMARFKLRRKLAQAELSVSGVNFAVAESGALVTLTSSGNDRMANALAPVHVTLMGLEKVVPTYEEMTLLMQLLSRSANGRLLTSYVNVLNGPRRMEERDGPSELYLVILDNGRSELLRHGYGEVLTCLRCGACLNYCPVYREVGGQAYGGALAGPIGAVTIPLMPRPPISEARTRQDRAGLGQWLSGWTGKTDYLWQDSPFADLPYASSLCGACKEVCPVGIDLPTLLLQLRNDSQVAGRATLGQRLGRWFYGWSMATAGRYRTSVSLARIAGRLLGRGHIRRLPPPWRAWTRDRPLPAPAQRSFRDRWHGKHE